MLIKHSRFLLGQCLFMLYAIKNSLQRFFKFFVKGKKSKTYIPLTLKKLISEALFFKFSFLSIL